MASQPIYQFYAELSDYKPKIWRRFQVLDNITMARLGYIIMTMFEMQASHLFCFDFPFDEYFKRDLTPKKETVVGEDGKEYVKLNTELSEEEVYNQQGLIKVDDNTYFKTAKEDLATLYENVRTYKEKYPKVLDGDYTLRYSPNNIRTALNLYKGLVSLSALSQISGINQRQLSHYLNGTSNPRKEQEEKHLEELKERVKTAEKEFKKALERYETK